MPFTVIIVCLDKIYIEKVFVLCEIRGSHSGVAEDSHLLRCDAVLGEWFPRF
jgi:hypothetical protein